MNISKETYNKFAKFAAFAVLTARDAFTTRPLQRRYEHGIADLSK